MCEFPPLPPETLDPPEDLYTIKITYLPASDTWEWRVIDCSGHTAWKPDGWGGAVGTAWSRDRAMRKAEKMVAKICKEARKRAEQKKISAEKSFSYEVRCVEVEQ